LTRRLDAPPGFVDTGFDGLPVDANRSRRFLAKIAYEPSGVAESLEHREIAELNADARHDRRGSLRSGLPVALTSEPIRLDVAVTLARELCTAPSEAGVAHVARLEHLDEQPERISSGIHQNARARFSSSLPSTETLAP
jgi:hypothetical protein